MHPHTLPALFFSALLVGCNDGGGGKSDTADSGDSSGADFTLPDPLPGSGSTDFSGDITCDAPQSIQFDGEKSEVVTLFTQFTQDGDSAKGANPSVTLRLNGAEIVRDGNPVTISGATYVGQPVEGSWMLNLPEDGTYELFYAVGDCQPIHFTSTLTRVRIASSNLEMSTATPVEAGVAVAGVLGCGEERWYSFAADAGDTVRMGFGGVSIVEYEGGVFREGGASLDLIDAGGEHVLYAGNGVSVFHYITGASGTASQDFTIESAGTYFLRANYWNGCTIGDIYVHYSLR